MVEGKERVDWNRLSHLLALHANINRDPKKVRSFKLSDFNPFFTEKQKKTFVSLGPAKEYFERGFKKWESGKAPSEQVEPS